MTDRSESPGSDPNSSASDAVNVSPNNFQSITDMDRQMASFALKEFHQGNYELCLKSLNYLEDSRPQDSKVLHNVCIAEHYRTKSSNVTAFYNSLLDVCKQAHIDVLDIDFIDDVDQCVVFYNRTVALYHLHQYQAGIDILDKIFQFVEPLDESLGKKICFLLLELYLCTYQPKKALGLIGYIETIAFGSSNGNTNSNNSNGKTMPEKEESKDVTISDKEKMQLIQCKARCYTMMKTAKSCKREVKLLMNSGSQVQQVAAFFLKSQLEYQRGNYRKAIKILSSPEWPSDLSKYFSGTGDCLQAIQYNNLGCIYNSMGKPGLGVHYTELGYKVLESEMQKSKEEPMEEFPSGHPMYMLSLNVRRALIYNMGMQHFRREKYEGAFKCFIEAAHTYSRNPLLWLRIAECCISINKIHRIGSKENPIVKAVVGAGKCKKIHLNPFDKLAPTNFNEEMKSVPQPTLEYAMRCLRNALFLLPKAIPPSEVAEKDPLALPVSSIDDKEFNLPQEAFVIPTLPCKSLTGDQVQSFRNTILIACAYVSLRLGNTVPALHYATTLLSQPKFSDAHKFLAHMYAGHALTLMDRISEAVEHFKPKLFTDISVAFPSNGDDASSSNSNRASSLPPENSMNEEVLCSKQKWHPSTLVSAKLIAQFNLAVAHTLREEWSKANHLVNQIMTSSEAPTEALALMIYIHLCQGFTDRARDFINQCLPSHMKSPKNCNKNPVNESVEQTT